VGSSAAPNATTLQKGLQQRLREAGAPAGDWTDHGFRLDLWGKEMRKSDLSAERELADNAHWLGKAVRRGYKKWLSD
jgi:hypothetical protein